MRLPVLLLATVLPGFAQSVCPPTPAYSPCEIAFELSGAEAAAHPNPYASVQLDAEFRSPHFHTYRIPGFWDGGRRLFVRFAPTEPGDWLFRIDSNIARFEGQEGHFSATASSVPGLLHPFGPHHWAIVQENVKTPQLWMGDTLYTFPYIGRAAFDQVVSARTAQKFTHLRGVLLPPPGSREQAFFSPDEPNPAVFREIDSRILSMNRQGLIADLMLAYGNDQLTKLFPSREQRERYLRYVVGRYATMNVTWQCVEQFDTYENGRALLKELGQALARLDPYDHPRSTGAAITASPLASDGWMSYAASESAGDDLNAIEYQIYPLPFVNLKMGYEESGAGGANPDAIDAVTLRHRLWNVAMSGHSPTYGNAGTIGGNAAADPRYLDAPGAKQMTVWFDFFSRTRHWELEPYFEVDGGRALALEGVEYIVYVEKPGPVEVVVERHGYDVDWIDPATGISTRDKKGYKGEKFTGEPPDKSHDWVLHIAREGHIESMQKSYKFESRPFPPLQEIEQLPEKAPYEFAGPATDTLSVSAPAKFAARLTRENRATRRMLWLWTGEIPSCQRGFRVIGSGAEGTFRIPADISDSYPADIAVHLYGMNAHGKVYSLIQVFRLTQ